MREASPAVFAVFRNCNNDLRITNDGRTSCREKDLSVQQRVIAAAEIIGSGNYTRLKHHMINWERDL